MEYTAFKLYITIDPTDMKDFLGHWSGNLPPAAVVLVFVLVSDRTISFTKLSSYHSYANIFCH